MLVNVTFSLPEDTVKRLRKAAAVAGKGRKGAISELVDAAINEHLGEVESPPAQQFLATRDGKVIVNAPTLRELADELKRRKLDPRDFVIESSVPLEPLVRTGLRGLTA
jgi:hypothetical protein